MKNLAAFSPSRWAYERTGLPSYLVCETGKVASLGNEEFVMLVCILVTRIS